MHGEYKVPGGKLVVVDLDVDAGRLARVRLSGDFFLEPDEALEALDAALTGLPADSDAAALAARVRSALPPGAVLLGFTPEAVATTVRRAVGGATGWLDHDWQFVHTGPQAPQTHMALDEVLAREVAAGRRPPTLRVWEWASPAVVLGSFQSLVNEVDGEAARRLGVEVVRRISGGGAMFVEPGNTITYSLYAPGSLVEGLSFTESYAFLDDWVLVALGDLGVKAWHQPINDIATDQGKIAGAAQKRLADGTVLHHVTMSYDIDAAKMLQVLRIGREKLSGKGLASAAKRVDPLRRQTGLPREEVIDSMVATFRRQYGLTGSALTDAELDAAEELVRGKFATPEWVARIP
ncbi:lipoate--protein ligase family protein [Kineococcus radiotolerans]|uniref:Biotin/lipoate A/B protein ligase n=1 Tax=Kineococcus radiotolerans (strain ATCC BAA-149 / DSM 14245 / SRS30216) TaxID=266940 RepID=A6WFA5_KINRD|nr:lipoate--protein ligase family protein [Kineococcus radiotolerans]ABS05494.1 biotin/lipoate A/B protein ligase [Kineococcus radiotolerans SRS30216 = ATCC BAA-149]